MAVTLVSTTTLTNSSTTTIVFNNIPQTGKDLLLLVSARSTTAAANVALNCLVNNISTFTYNQIRLRGNGSTTDSSQDTGSNTFSHPQMSAANNTASNFGSTQWYFTNYTLSGEKLVSVESVTENNATAAQQLVVNGRLPSAGAITRFDVYDSSAGFFVSGTTASLYIIS